ncbi:unnamed protein product, partial [Ectocarpus sp. 12 AP-2014]
TAAAENKKLYEAFLAPNRSRSSSPRAAFSDGAPSTAAQQQEQQEVPQGGGDGAPGVADDTPGVTIPGTASQAAAAAAATAAASEAGSPGEAPATAAAAVAAAAGEAAAGGEGDEGASVGGDAPPRLPDVTAAGSPKKSSSFS